VTERERTIIAAAARVAGNAAGELAAIVDDGACR